jgi:hypothetical protein
MEMNNPELVITIGISVVAILVAGLDVFVRLVVAPHRKDRFVSALLDQLLEPAAEKESAAAPALDLNECLLRHFEKSVTSRAILSALDDEGGLSQTDLHRRLNQALSQSQKPPLPIEVARRVAMILLHAGLVGVDRGVLRLTEVGKNLNSVLRGRYGSGLNNAV